MSERPVADRVGASVWAGFAMMCVGMFMAVLDIQVVATSLPTIQTALQIRVDQMSWIQTAYLIAEVIAIPLTGFLTRALSMRWLFVIAVSVFTVASIGCASSNTYHALIAWRVVQGFSGGTLIPAVFSAVFLLFPPRLEAFATTIAGVLAVLAPTIGPVVGGWITHTFSWHWLFLINVIPGVVSAAAAGVLLPRESISRREFRSVDLAGLALLAVALSALEVALKEAPSRGWASAFVLGLCVVSALSAVAFTMHTVKRRNPIVDLWALRDGRFAVACLLSFILGIGLFGSVYVMPVFLAVVRGHDALQIGTIMLVTGVAQLLTAPLAVFLEKRLDARLLAAFGFALFAVGLAMSTRQSALTDFSEMFWPQIIRGVAIMFCLLPPTRLALGHLPLEKIPNASGLFNLMRNLGGAIGIALIDTVIFARAPDHVRSIAMQLAGGDLTTIREGGFPAQMLAAMQSANPTPEVTASMMLLVQRLAMARALNDAWVLMAVLTAAALAACVALKLTTKRGEFRLTSADV